LKEVELKKVDEKRQLKKIKEKEKKKS